jgi:hypothetical protein
VCGDGTDYAQRFGKTPEEIEKEYRRQDRVEAANRLMCRPDLPVQPNVKYGLFLWNDNDVDLAREMKIKL